MRAATAQVPVKNPYVEACRLLKLLNTRAGARRFVADYKRRTREAMRAGEEVISLAEWIDVLSLHCRIAGRGDPGGDLVYNPRTGFYERRP